MSRSRARNASIYAALVLGTRMTTYAKCGFRQVDNRA